MACKYFGYGFVSSECAPCEECDEVDECLTARGTSKKYRVVEYSFSENRCVAC